MREFPRILRHPDVRDAGSSEPDADHGDDLAVFAESEPGSPVHADLIERRTRPVRRELYEGCCERGAASTRAGGSDASSVAVDDESRPRCQQSPECRLVCVLPGVKKRACDVASATLIEPLPRAPTRETAVRHTDTALRVRPEEIHASRDVDPYCTSPLGSSLSDSMLKPTVCLVASSTTKRGS